VQVLADGSQVQLVPQRRFHDAVAQLVQPERLSRFTQEQALVALEPPALIPTRDARRKGGAGSACSPL
jgi:hypothetical protein